MKDSRDISMKLRTFRHIRLLVVSLLVAGWCAGCSEPPAGDSAGPLRFELLDLSGAAVDLIEGHDGPATVFLFTRSDCPVSNRYARVVHRVVERFGPRGVRFFLVYVDPDEGPPVIRAHMSEYGYTCAAVRDPEHRLVKLTGATRTPEAAVLDRDRALRYRGRIDDQYIDFGKARPAALRHDLADALEAILAGREVVNRFTDAVGCYIVDLQPAE